MNERTNAFQFSQFKFSNFFLLFTVVEVENAVDFRCFLFEHKSGSMSIFVILKNSCLILASHNRNTSEKWQAFEEWRLASSTPQLSYILESFTDGYANFRNTSLFFLPWTLHRKEKTSPNTKRTKPVKMMALRERRDEKKSIVNICFVSKEFSLHSISSFLCFSLLSVHGGAKNKRQQFCWIR